MRLEILPVAGLGEIHPGDDLAACLVAAGADLRDGDVVVVAQKVVSKAEGALVAVDGDDREARRRVAAGQAVRVVVDSPQALIVQTSHGFVCANAGVDASNVPIGMVALLPDDPDRSAATLRAGLHAQLGIDVGVVVTDTFGRPWRAGHVDVAIGVAGLAPLRDERGGTDLKGRVLEVTVVAVADELAAAADLVRRKADGVPVVVVRGYGSAVGHAGGSARELVRTGPQDLFPRGRGALAAALATHGGLERSDPGLPVTDDVLQAALAAARGLVGADVAVEGAGDVLRVSAPDAAAAGAAGAALVAALADLGVAARLLLGAPGSGAVEVALGAAEPPAGAGG
jgi:coenzyme F420-0:L-glutamate ligase / coenzyme F420-1:gamma-L-glutamate ligase